VLLVAIPFNWPFPISLVEPTVYRIFHSGFHGKRLMHRPIGDIVWKVVQDAWPKHNSPLFGLYNQVAQKGKVSASARFHVV
jgi:hypothetical protein